MILQIRPQIFKEIIISLLSYHLQVRFVLFQFPNSFLIVMRIAAANEKLWNEQAFWDCRALLVTSRITRSDKVRCSPEPVSSSSCVVVVAVSSSAWSKSTYVQNEITISLFFEQKNEPDRRWRSSCFPFYNSLLSYQWWSVHLATTSSNFSATTKLPIIWRWPLTLILSTSWKRSDLEPYAMHDAVVSASLRLKSTTTD